MKKRFFLTLLFFSFFLQGCVQGVVHGFVYEHTTRPLTSHFDRTPVGSKTGRLGTKQLDIQMEVNWDSNSIGDIARHYGFKKLYYADIETLSVLGVWEQNWVHLYGE